MTTSTVEDYLKCILLNEEAEKRQVAMGTIAESLSVAPGTVTAMMKTLSESGLVAYEPYAGVKLTKSGRKLAAHVLRRHRLVELFLVRVMKIDWIHVHDEAERLEHAMSDLLIQRMDEMLGFPSVDPHGDPIPAADGSLDQSTFPSLLECEVGVPLEVVRVTDQTVSFLQLMEKGQLTPGSQVQVTDRSEPADSVGLEVGNQQQFQLGFRAASKVLVRIAEASSGA